ncbi:hypothetical protein L873DRAFT_1840521 [Choiromyces venosus 120613-1]|uniref:PCI domain-containing protein n=1 Tax=Choiromyces venosus 120613-1 TaxID=1336337 RepID=A0A3N4K565_9PEZI|nr:hypothetical protein L873DRAFT_1840521 [Choiromyces venosus 120613-1]
MADEQYLTSLQPFILLAKSATGRAAADLVMQATAAPGCFVFSELLEMPNIQALANTGDGRRYYDLLKVFAYGWYGDYRDNAPNLPPLTPAHLHKLKQLSLITLSSQGPQNLTYPSLQRTLDLPSTRALEDLTISAIYAHLLVAKLDTKASRIEVSSTAGRDVAPEEVPDMIATLKNWCRQCEDVLGDIDEQVRCVQREAVAKKRAADEYERIVAGRKEIIKNEEKGVGVGGGGGGGGGGSIATAVQAAGKGKRVISEGDENSIRGSGGWGEDDEMEIDEGGPFDGVATSPTVGAPAGGSANTSKRRTKKGLGGILGGRHGRR